MNSSRYLACAPQYSTTGELLATAARWRGMDIEVLTGPGAAAALKGRAGGHYFGGPGFAARVVDDLDVALLEPEDDWLTSLPRAFAGRKVSSTTLVQARALPGPLFAKPPSAKSFPAAVYADGSELPEVGELPPETPVQISEVVTWAREFRLFILDGECRTGSQYARFGRLESAPLRGHADEAAVRTFARDLLAAHGETLPSAVVLDVGVVARAGGDEWAVVEANMPWFANCYAADPDRALDVVLRAAGPRSRLEARDRRFCRHFRTLPSWDWTSHPS
ncbi:ATP-grasp domain-containing protein [Streptomyces sp. NPDC049577]|uniref:ATP-grasp domain-containing protein n=1 Tax=Streptomyces sp. NPDC049577 TaxID=3155153 RepID=UPI003431EA30